MMKKRKTREKGVRSVLEEGIVNLLSRAEDEEIDKIISVRKKNSQIIDERYSRRLDTLHTFVKEDIAF